MSKRKDAEAPNQKYNSNYRHNAAKSQVTEETRQEAYINRPFERKRMILDCMGDRPMTSRQIARALGFGSDMNAVRPRLTELLAEGKITVEGKALDQTTERHVAVYKAV